MSRVLTVQLPSPIRLCILVEDSLTSSQPKTASCVVRFRPDDVVALLDSHSVGLDAAPWLGVEVAPPVVATIADAVALGANALLIGIAPRGGGLPEEFRAVIRDALLAHLHVISGLHVFLADDAEYAALAASRGVELLDLRRPPDLLSLPPEQSTPWPGPVVHTVGSDCAVGKMTVSLLLAQALAARGWGAVMGATGQTGILLTGWGIATDRVIADFGAGATHAIVEEGFRRGRCVVVEGQGSIVHPAYSGVTMSLLHGARADALVLVHDPTRTTIRGYDVPIPPLPALIALYEQLAAPVKPVRVVAIALHTGALDAGAAAAIRTAIARETGLPTVDPVRDGTDVLADAVQRGLAECGVVR